MSGLYYTCVGLDSVVLTSERVYTHRDLSLNIYIHMIRVLTMHLPKTVIVLR